jgi:hypothetical protein
MRNLFGECRGDFETVGELGRSSMGVAYEVGQGSLGRSVAMKAIHLRIGQDPGC